ncbi:MAG: AraC family transcriptional regulator [Lachnospiraceae bacterium]|nr:AraC family transcriptional regulator [Lachnospiraceae bacterium]
MEWAESISKAIEYIENNITEDISVEDIAKHVNISPFYFQKGFRLLCGYTIAEYMRNRRLALAAGELAKEDTKVIDIAMKYGYDSPDSFTVMGAVKKFAYDGAKAVIPEFWKEHYERGNGKYVCGMFGINMDESMGNSEFEYMIADIYNPVMDVPEGFVTKTIPAFTWAVFPCKGSMPASMQDVNTKIFSEWLPALKEYEFAAGYCIEMYDDPDKYPKGTSDENYYSEIWIPVKKK